MSNINTDNYVLDESWDLANNAKERLAKLDTEDMREQIVETFMSEGCYHVWISVFRDDADMIKRFNDELQNDRDSQ